MKLLIATRADDNIKSITDLTHPIIKDYAKRCNADFISLNHIADCPGNGRFHFRIMKLKELYETYDRILSLDSDVVINSSCPNLFKMISYYKIATVYEDQGSRQAKRRSRIHNAQKKFGDIGWEKGYINTGVFLTSKCHQNIFEKIDGMYWDDWGYDDVHLGYLIKKYNYPVHELSYRYNHMSMFSEKWNNSPDRFNSYIIHYAGGGTFDAPNRVKQIKNDIKKIYR